MKSFRPLSENSGVDRRTFLKGVGGGLTAFIPAAIGLTNIPSAQAAPTRCVEKTCSSVTTNPCINGYIYNVTQTTCVDKYDHGFCSYGETKMKTGRTC